MTHAPRKEVRGRVKEASGTFGRVLPVQVV